MYSGSETQLIMGFSHTPKGLCFMPIGINDSRSEWETSKLYYCSKKKKSAVKTWIQLYIDKTLAKFAKDLSV